MIVSRLLMAKGNPILKHAYAEIRFNLIFVAKYPEILRSNP